MALPTRKPLILSVSAVTREICHQKRTLRAATAQVFFGSWLRDNALTQAPPSAIRSM